MPYVVSILGEGLGLYTLNLLKSLLFKLHGAKATAVSAITCVKFLHSRESHKTLP